MNSNLTFDDAAPTDCPIQKSPDFSGIRFTGRHAEYTTADTWYPSWATDGHLYSPFTDGSVDGVLCFSSPPGPGRGEGWVTGNARIEGDDPLALTVIPLGTVKGLAAPYGGRYPCANLVHDGIWYYGTYCLDWHNDPWDIMGPFVGFRISHDFGKTWDESPRSPADPLFGERLKPADAPALDSIAPNISAKEYAAMPKVKMGSPHFVDFGKNMQHSPDGMAYLLAHGSSRPGSTCSWISGDQIYLARVKPSPETINDPAAYEYFAGHDANQQPIWLADFSKIVPLLEWNDRLGCVTATWNPILKRYIMCVTDGGRSGIGTFNTMILEAESLTGPWQRVTLMEKFGQQAYFVNIPSKFIAADGSMWMCYSANYPWDGPTAIQPIPEGSRYAMCLQEFNLLPAIS